MKIYRIAYFNYNDSENILLSNEHEYTDEEFKRLCDEAYDKYKYHPKVWKKSEYMIDCQDMADYLVKEYEFEYSDIICYVANNNSVQIIDDGCL